jgi:hypothetical protein
MSDQRSNSHAAVLIVLGALALPFVEPRGKDGNGLPLVSAPFIEPAFRFRCGNCMSCLNGHKVPTLKSDPGDLDHPHSECLSLERFGEGR